MSGYSSFRCDASVFGRGLAVMAWEGDECTAEVVGWDIKMAEPGGDTGV